MTDFTFNAESNHILYNQIGLAFQGDAPTGASDIDFTDNRILGPDPEIFNDGLAGVVAQYNWWGGDGVDVVGDGTPIDTSNPLISDPGPSVTSP